MKTKKDSSHEQLQDVWTNTLLKNAVLPAVLPSQVEAFTQALIASKRTPSWVLPTGFAAVAGSAALVAALVLIHPTASFAAPTLSQVDQAQQAVKSFTVIHRVGSDGADFYVVTESRDGDRWKTTYGPPKGAPYAQIIMDGRQTVSVYRFKKRFEVLVDGPSKNPKRLLELPTPENFLASPSELFLSRPGKITVKRGVHWNGKVVDEFESIAMISPGNLKKHFRRVLYADSVSHLPLQLETNLPDSKVSLSEIFTYDYTPIQDAAFVASIPKGAKVTDVRRERQAVHDALTKDGLVIVDDSYDAGVFLPDQTAILRAAKANKVRVRIDAGPPSYTLPQLVYVSASGNADPKAPWRQPVIYVQPPVVNLAALRLKNRVTVHVNDKPFSMRVRRVANALIEFDYPGRRM